MKLLKIKNEIFNIYVYSSVYCGVVVNNGRLSFPCFRFSFRDRNLYII